ncbi:MAG TPA: efflux RND transporter periplasmic adaptor subunit [Verrucomicrobiae bacterium]|nr:efflux RND transporter periplasmic adaptor subunit [Verrucomicrobiae bacterium]
MRFVQKRIIYAGANRIARCGVSALAAIGTSGCLFLCSCGHSDPTAAAEAASSTTNAAQGEASIELTTNQLSAIQIQPVGTYLFPEDKEAVGTIDFDENRSVQVFPPYQGKLMTTFVAMGDEVEKGQPLYTIDSPDLIQAESALITAAATLDLTSKELARVKDLYGTNGISQRELEQATSDQQAAEGALKAAHDALRVFGKMDSEIDLVAKSRRIDRALVVRSPITGQVTAMNAPPGLLVQPGTGSAPFSVADLGTKWMLANVIESDSPLYRVGQPVQVKVLAYADRVFKGTIAKVYPIVDPNTHRFTVRSEIKDPKDELRPGMLANFTIQVRAPVESVAIPAEGVVRNGDGTMASWVTTDRHRFSERLVKIGLERDGRYEVLDGLHKGELAVTDGAVFLSNLLEAPPTD